MTPSPHRSVVLVVDDDPDLRAAISDLLEDEGYAVTSAADGREALAVLRAGLRPAVILLDLSMPVMSGSDFREYQLKDPGLREIPVVVFTAMGSELGDARWQTAGVSVFPKPFDVDELVALVATFPPPPPA
jgi:CheY-like chemotaxis protein